MHTVPAQAKKRCHFMMLSFRFGAETQIMLALSFGICSRPIRHREQFVGEVNHF